MGRCMEQHKITTCISTNNNLDYFMNSSCNQNYKNEITPQEYKN